VQHLAASKEYCELYLVAFLQELACVIQLDIEIMLLGFGSEPDFLESHRVVVVFLVGLPKPAFLLIQPFAIIHYPADRRVTVRSDLDKIQPGFARLTDCFVPGHDSHLIA
jgi:hypothetical protein